MKRILSIASVSILILIVCIIPASAANGYSYTPPSWAQAEGGNFWMAPDSTTNINVQVTGNINHETPDDCLGAQKDVYYNQITQTIASIYTNTFNISEDEIVFSDLLSERYAGYDAVALEIKTPSLYQYEVMFFTDENIYTVAFTTTYNSAYSVSDFKDSLESFSIDGYPAVEAITEETTEETVEDYTEEISLAEKSAKKKDTKEADSKKDDEKDITPIIIAVAAVAIVLIVAVTIIIVSKNKKKSAAINNAPQYPQGNPYAPPYNPQQPQYPQQPPQNNGNSFWEDNNRQ